jgi:pilus assembly protein CpaB
MKSRDVFIIIIALMVSIAVAVGTRYILRDDADKSLTVTKVMVAASDLAVGKRLDKSNTRWQEWPKATLQPTYITEENKELSEKVMGYLVRNHIAPGDPITVANLSSEKTGYLSAMIDPNQRAVTIPLDNRSNISGKVLPGDYVDVIVAAQDKKTFVYVANTVVRKVKVLEINGNLDPNAVEDASKPKPLSITLQVTPKQAELLAAALREGTPVISLQSMDSKDVEVSLPKAPVVVAAPAPEPKVQDETVVVMRGHDVQKIQEKH